VNWPVTWIQGDPCDGSRMAGTQVCAVSGLKVEPLELNGELVGTVYDDDLARYCLLGDIRPASTTASQADQARAVFDKMQAALAHTGMSFRNVVRTWMYLADLLNWYGAFNTARTRFFNDHDVFSTMMPASTGIGVLNPFGSALVASAFGFAPTDGRVSIQTVPSPLQCSAANYKSSFSRAAEVIYPDWRHLFVSGTASITPNGETAYRDDAAHQIALTMRVTDAILRSRGMTWDNVSRAIAYFKNMKDVPLYTAYCHDKNMPRMPVTLFHADICRADLLFEIELDALACTGDASQNR
jgi:enamine deaminase RidA (YjgF/YER057c/UK114 family)